MSDAYRLGIDIGTTFTAAAVDGTASTQMLSLGRDRPEMPSVVAVGDNRLIVGDPAERRALSDPSNVAREFKRRVGDSVPLLLSGQPWSAEMLTAEIVRHILGHCLELFGKPPSLVVMTHPANWHGHRLSCLQQAMDLAGVTHSELIPEPVAAARYYQATKGFDAGGSFAVFDLGGGTFDATVVEARRRGLRVRGTPQGLEHFGGIDLDFALFSHVLDAVGVDVAELEDTSVNRQAIGRLRADCRTAKEFLSSDTSVVVPVMLPGLHTEVRINRAEFESLLGPLLARAIDVVKLALEEAALEAADLTGVLLVGGGSRIPLISQLLKRTFNTTVLVDAHPKHTVALGAVATTPMEHDATASAGFYRRSGNGQVDLVAVPAEEPQQPNGWEFAEDPKPLWAAAHALPDEVAQDDSIDPGESLRSWADRLWPTNPQSRHGGRS